MDKEKIRLQKYLAQCGIASRRKAEELISLGKVKINGRAAGLGDKIDPVRDKVFLEGRRVVNQTAKRYVMLHKPRGFVTTLHDEQDRKCVAQLVSDAGDRLFPVGRLDKESEGLLLMTNDGEFANLLTHPSHHVPKTYRVTVREKVTETHLDQMTAGLIIDGRETLPCEVWVIDRGENRTVLNFVLYEGRNRQIRKMCEEVGLTVIRLKRVAVGNVKLGMLPVGKWRELEEKEVRYLQNSAGTASKQERKDKNADRASAKGKR